jgi:hypothetical protein
MVVLHKGWLFWREREVAPDALVRWGRLRAAGVLRGRPWWRRASGRWKRI